MNGNLDVFLASDLRSSPFKVASPLRPPVRDQDPRDLPDLKDEDEPFSSPIMQFLYKRPQASFLNPIISRAPATDPYHHRLLRFVAEMGREASRPPAITEVGPLIWGDDASPSTGFEDEDVFHSRLGVEDSPGGLIDFGWGEESGTGDWEYGWEGSSPVMKERLFTE